MHDLTEAVLGCVCAALRTTAEEAPGQGCSDRACVVPGTVVWDWCDDPGSYADIVPTSIEMRAGCPLHVKTPRLNAATWRRLPC